MLYVLTQITYCTITIRHFQPSCIEILHLGRSAFVVHFKYDAVGASMDNMYVRWKYRALLQLRFFSFLVALCQRTRCCNSSCRISVCLVDVQMRRTALISTILVPISTLVDDSKKPTLFSIAALFKRYLNNAVVLVSFSHLNRDQLLSQPTAVYNLTLSALVCSRCR